MLIRRAAAPLIALALAVPLTVGVAAAERPERRGPATVTFTGTGWGHGVGLSQYGARNRANAGHTYRQILRAYYPGTTWGRTGGVVRVRLDADTTKDVQVLAMPGLKLQQVGKRAQRRLPATVKSKQVQRWRIVPTAAGSKVQWKARGAWRGWKSLRSDAQFTARGPITLVTPGGRAAYRGALRATHRDTVNVVPLEGYLRGLVPNEMAAEWPAQAVRAQAVAARTYAAYERRDHRSDYYDTCDTDACQVYSGYDGEHPQSNAAVRATGRQVLTYGGGLAFTQFSSSNGGYTVAGSVHGQPVPYLPARPDPFDHGHPDDPWSVTVPAADITRNWADTGDLVSIEVLATDAGGRVTQLRVTGTGAVHDVSGETFRSWLGLRSTLFRIT
ncbi:SpoIID/LytB domain-containing protein [Nocardioides sp. MAH-18]|uniref:SpoIID/LytB domain-containing protein n=1 Tax=Nocardioides agri TaxID=2682843 RepID=A0A6L6XNF8_9ACTN|nr:MULTISPECIES: SpoIID/LytB domain-containing protein [unclassified Nocardioides]MBA2953947.1 SpoIID/LytB domain-containing protein [Nocardioides sp. CGMCC 1.13656]MVQ48809.1 SpoIID/LytB domain-containing protein [Nocardioides sp. MAH-18]